MLYFIKRGISQKYFIEAMGRFKAQLVFDYQGGTVDSIYPIITDNEMSIVVVHSVTPCDTSLTIFEDIIRIKHRIEIKQSIPFEKFKLHKHQVIEILQKMISKLHKDIIYQDFFFKKLSDACYLHNSKYQVAAFEIMKVIVLEYGILIGAKKDYQKDDFYMSSRDITTNIVDTITSIESKSSRYDKFDTNFKLGVEQYR